MGFSAAERESWEAEKFKVHRNDNLPELIQAIESGES